MARGARRVRNLVLATSVATGALCNVAAQAQDAPPAPTSAEEVVVTGSRIRRANETQSTPVNTMTSADIEQRGVVNITEVLNTIPAVGANTLSPSGAPRNTLLAGLYTVDLRALGSSRTLVLVDGKRYVSGLQGSSAVDLSSIPTDLIQRVEVTTGGGSAVYGSDAIAGVVNIILKKKIEGVEFHAQGGMSTHGDGRQGKLGVIGGGSFSGDRGSVVLYANYDRTDPVYAIDRDISRDGVTVADPTRPDLALYGPASYTSVRTRQGVFGLNGATVTGSTIQRTILADGTVTTPLGARDGDNPNKYNIVVLPMEREIVGGRLRYDLSDDITLTFDPTYSRQKTRQQFEPTFITSGSSNVGGPTGVSNTIPLTNPFIPAALRALVPSTRTDISVSRDFPEFGPRPIDYTRQLYRVVTGVEGKLPFLGSSWRWDAYYEYGRTTLDETMYNGIDTARLYQGLRVESNGSGGFRCVDASARALGCVPINLFTGTSLTKAERDYLLASASISSMNEQQVAAGSVTGELFNLPAGPVGFAAGGEWRRESSNYVPSANLQQGTISLQFAGVTKGEFDVKEGFTELTVPVLKDLPFVDYLELEGAFRYADYSTSGSATAWKVGGTWRPFHDLRLRSIASKAVRAPNINDLYRGATNNLANVSDPCRGGGTTTARRLYCLSQPGITSAFNPPATTQVQQSVLGNAALKPEVARTFTVGGVYSPSAIPGLSLSVDYFRIKIDQAITSLAAQTVIDQCANSNDPSYCSTVIRDPSSGIITRNNSIPINAASERMTGVDVELSYRAALDDVFGWGRLGDMLTATVNYTNTISYKQVPFAGGTPLELRGQPFYPRHKANFRLAYDNGPFTVSLNERMIGNVYRVTGGNFAGNDVPAFWYTDMQLRYALSDKHSLYVGVNNLFDKQPPFYPVPYVGTSTGTNTAASVYELTGRFIYAGASLKF